MPTKKTSDADSSAGEPRDAAEAVKKPTTRTRRPASAPEGAEADAKAPRKTKSTARKVAEAVTETVKEIAEKVTGKSTRAKAPAKPRATASARAKTASAEADEAVQEASTKPASRAAAAKSTTTRKSSAPLSRKAASADSPDEPKSRAKSPAKTASKTTRVGALSDDITSEDVRASVDAGLSSGDVPAESAEKSAAATDVREHYFEDQHVHQGPPPPERPRDLPDEYGDTRIVLLVRDPEWVYAYWEVNDARRNELGLSRNGDGNYRLVLRIYKITGTNWPEQAAHYFFDVEVPRDSRNWYIHLPESDQQWCAELGMFDQHDNYIPVCRSNTVVTPRNTISDRIDSDWMTVEESFEKITRLSRETIEAQLRGSAGVAGSEAILRTINRQLTAVLHGERAALSSGIFSSESPVPSAKGKGFWLQVHTELILYGATEPDAKVTVQGRPVDLNPDGTFSIRYALPDGEQILDVHAVNADGDLEEEITPVVNRSTR